MELFNESMLMIWRLLVQLKPKIGDLVRRIHCPHVGIIIETQGIDVSVHWLQPFWIQDKRVEISTFPRKIGAIINQNYPF